MIAHACDPSIQEIEVKAGWSDLQGHLQLHSVWASLGYMKLYLRREEERAEGRDNV